jgi:hypothetical protein
MAPPCPVPKVELWIVAPLASVSCGAVTLTLPPWPSAVIDEIDAAPSIASEPADTETEPPSPASARLSTVLAVDIVMAPVAVTAMLPLGGPPADPA